MARSEFEQSCKLHFLCLNSSHHPELSDSAVQCRELQPFFFCAIAWNILFRYVSVHTSLCETCRWCNTFRLQTGEALHPHTSFSSKGLSMHTAYCSQGEDLCANAVFQAGISSRRRQTCSIPCLPGRGLNTCCACHTSRTCFNRCVKHVF